MTFRVINLDTGEIAAELGDYEVAVKLADKLAEDCEHRETWAVVELVTRYQTKGR
jgi:hypothetical protein